MPTIFCARVRLSAFVATGTTFPPSSLFRVCFLWFSGSVSMGFHSFPFVLEFDPRSGDYGLGFFGERGVDCLIALHYTAVWAHLDAFSITTVDNM